MREMLPCRALVDILLPIVARGRGGRERIATVEDAIIDQGEGRSNNGRGPSVPFFSRRELVNQSLVVFSLIPQWILAGINVGVDKSLLPE